jgi:hypothetical protein
MVVDIVPRLWLAHSALMRVVGEENLGLVMVEGIHSIRKSVDLIKGLRGVWEFPLSVEALRDIFEPVIKEVDFAYIYSCPRPLVSPVLQDPRNVGLPETAILALNAVGLSTAQIEQVNDSIIKTQRDIATRVDRNLKGEARAIDNLLLTVSESLDSQLKDILMGATDENDGLYRLQVVPAIQVWLMTWYRLSTVGRPPTHYNAPCTSFNLMDQAIEHLKAVDRDMDRLFDDLLASIPSDARRTSNTAQIIVEYARCSFNVYLLIADMPFMKMLGLEGPRKEAAKVAQEMTARWIWRAKQAIVYHTVCLHTVKKSIDLEQETSKIGKPVKKSKRSGKKHH